MKRVLHNGACLRYLFRRYKGVAPPSSASPLRHARTVLATGQRNVICLLFTSTGEWHGGLRSLQVPKPPTALHLPAEP